MSVLKWIKKEVLFADHLSNKELLRLVIMVMAIAPLIYLSIIGVFALGYMLQG